MDALEILREAQNRIDCKKAGDSDSDCLCQTLCTNIKCQTMGLIQQALPLVKQMQKETKANDFWKELVVKDNELDIEQVKKELHDFYFIMEQVPKVYMAVTGDKLSKVMYPAGTVIREFEDYLGQQIRENVTEETKDLKEEFQATIDGLVGALEVIDAIARNATKLTSPLYPETLKMIRAKAKQALASAKGKE